MLARLIGDLTLPIFAVVAIAAFLAFGFGASLDVVIAVLLLGILTALAESVARSST